MSAGAMQLVAGSASVRLAASMGESVGVEPVARELERFPDGEIHVRLHDELRDDDVYLVQSTGPPTQEHLTELFLLADAAHRAGAARITAVVPYLAYARQDRRTANGEPVGLRVVAELLRASHVDRLIVVDPHTPALESIVSVPVETTTAVPLLAAALREDTDARTGADASAAEAVLVAPDLGAAKLVERYAAELGHEVAIVRKTRLSGDEVEAGAVVGDVAGRRPIIVDDMISTGGTLASAVEALTDAGATGPVTVAASHGLMVGPAVARLLDAGVDTLVTTDALEIPESDLHVVIVGLGDRLGEVVHRLHHGQPLDELAAHR